MAHTILISYWSRFNSTTCVIAAPRLFLHSVCRWAAGQPCWLTSRADIEALFPSHCICQLMIPRAAPVIGTLWITRIKTISARTNTFCDGTKRQARRGDSLNYGPSRVFINNNRDNIWVAGPPPCLGNCCICSCTSGWRQHKAAKYIMSRANSH